MNKRIKLISSLVILTPLLVSANFSLPKLSSDFDENKFMIEFSNQFFKTAEWNKNVKVDHKKYEVDYTIDSEMQDFIQERLRHYGSDHASVVVVDNNTGEVLSAVDYERNTRKIGKTLSFSTTNPAASIFKLITAADLLEKKQANEGTLFSYSGRTSTLYRGQLKEKNNRWTKLASLNKAFATSNNVIFGKAALQKSSYGSLKETAKKFGFEDQLLQLIDVGYSQVYEADDSYALAELASGFNRETLISPLHGAMMASIIANGGLRKNAYLVSKVTDLDGNQTVWRPKYTVRRVISKESALQLQSMMQETVETGTARTAFRKWADRKQSLEIGGKTGSITGGLPFGKRDWFISYGMPIGSTDKGISVCVMIVNVKKWYVKSTVLAKEIFQYYNKKKQKV